MRKQREEHTTAINSINLNKIHRRCLDMANNFHHICSQNGIPYYMLGGTMLGAIRHKGFIPWDDDMDFGIPRQFYTKAISLLEQNLPKQYVLRKATLGEAHYDSVKICDTDTTIEEIDCIGTKKNVFIDLFPLDYGNNYWHMFSRNWCIKNLMALNGYRWRTAKTFQTLFVKSIVRAFPANFFLNCARQLLRKDGNFYINYGGYWDKKETIKTSVFGTPLKYQFEDATFYGVENAHEYLTALYNDYMSLPSPDQRHTHIVYFHEIVREDHKQL